MNQKEYDYWKTVTASSEHLWVEDAITRLNDQIPQDSGEMIQQGTVM